MRHQYRSGIRASQLLARHDMQHLRDPWYVPLPEPAPLPRNLEVALLTLARSDKARQVLDALRAANLAPTPVRADYEALASLSLAVRECSGYHAISPLGVWRVGLIVIDMWQCRCVCGTLKRARPCNVHSAGHPQHPSCAPRPRALPAAKNLCGDAAGICCICKYEIRASRGERWIVEHLKPLWLGGADDESNMFPAHEQCAIQKTVKEAPIKAKSDRVRANHLGIKKTKKRGSFLTNKDGPFKRKLTGELVRR